MTRCGISHVFQVVGQNHRLCGARIWEPERRSGRHSAMFDESAISVDEKEEKDVSLGV